MKRENITPRGNIGKTKECGDLTVASYSASQLTMTNGTERIILTLAECRRIAEMIPRLEAMEGRR